MKKETIVLVVLIAIALVAGGVIGATISGQSEKRSDNNAHANHVQAASDSQSEIQLLKDLLKAEPENRNAWVQLGNNLIEANQLVAAIDAYDKALAINRNDPDVLTDQGIMFRQVGWHQKALENFL